MKLPVYPMELLPEISVAMQKENLNYSRHFVPISQDLLKKQNETLPSNSVPVSAAYRNKFFLVQIYKHPGEVIRISINRSELNDEGFWKDGISWDEIQHIKNAIGYENHDAIEIYPKKKDVVDVANIRHIWILKDHNLDFIWRRNE